MKILLVQTAFIGDVILSTPLIKAIRYKHPQAKLWLLTTPIASKLFQYENELSGVITFDKRKKFKGIKGLLNFSKVIKEHKFDLVYSLHKSFRTSILLKLSGIEKRVGFSSAKGSFLYTEKIKKPTSKHDVLRNLSILNLTPNVMDELAEMNLVQPELSEISSEIKDFILSSNSNQKPYVVVAPGSVWKTKRYHSEGYNQVVNYLESQDYQVVLVGGPDEVKISEQVNLGNNTLNLTGKTSIPELLALIANSETVICNDSMALHVASAFKKKVVVSFCATSPEFGFGPWRTNSKIVQKQELACRPCMRHGSNSCPNGTNACRTFSSLKIIKAFESLNHKDV